MLHLQHLSGHRALLMLQVKFYNVREKRVIRDLDPSDIGKLVAVSGMVTRASNVIPDLRSTFKICNPSHVDRPFLDDHSPPPPSPCTSTICAFLSQPSCLRTSFHDDRPFSDNGPNNLQAFLSRTLDKASTNTCWIFGSGARLLPCLEASPRPGLTAHEAEVCSAICTVGANLLHSKPFLPASSVLH